MAEDMFSSPIIFILALLLLFALLIGFGGSRLPGIQAQENTLLTTQVGAVGGEASSFRHITFPGFTVSHTQVEKMVFSESSPFTIVRGAISQKEHEIRFNVAQEELPFIERGKITFNVINTNSYGSMQILLNGQLIWSNYSEPGIVEIDVGPYGGLFRSGENLVEVECTSSGWRVWAPTEYVIEAFTLLEEARTLDEKNLDFTLSGAEAASTSLGKVVFTVSDSQTDGPLVIKVNAAQTWEGKPSISTYDTEFPGTNLKAGKNTVTFKVLPGGRYSLSKSEVVLSYGGVKAYEFNVTVDQLKQMREGKLQGSIEFDVQSGDGELTVTLVGETETVLFTGTAAPGKKQLTFTDSDVIADMNTLSLSSTNGIYNIGELKVLLWPK